MGILRHRANRRAVLIAVTVALCAMWGWSYRWGYLAGTSDRIGVGIMVASVRGRLAVTWGLQHSMPPGWSWDSAPNPDLGDFAGIGNGMFGADWDDRDGIVWSPYWLPTVAVAVATMWAWRRRPGAVGGFPVMQATRPYTSQKTEMGME